MTKAEVQERGNNIDQAKLYTWRAHSLWASHRWLEAAACFDEALRLNPADDDAEESRTKLREWSGETCTLKDETNQQ